jgi:hypothetical protein
VKTGSPDSWVEQQPRPLLAVLAILERDPGQQREAIVSRQQFSLDLLPLARPVAPECPHVRVGRIVPSSPTQPFVGRVQRVVGRQLRKDRHTKQMMPGIGNDQDAAVEISAILLQCMSLFMALSGHAASTIWSPLSVAERTLANVVHRPQFNEYTP